MTSEVFPEMQYPIAIKWIFKDFLNHCTGGERFKTHRYRLPGFPVTYYLTFEFEQIDDADPDFKIKLNCYCDYDNVEIEADYKIYAELFSSRRLSGKSFRETKCTFTNEITEVESYAVEEWRWWDNGEIIFTLGGTFTIKNLHSIPLSLRVPKNNQNMFADDDGKDFTIVAEGKDIKVHKSILQQVSPVFSAMFESKWKESVEGKIEIPFLAFKLAKLLIDLFYGKKYWRFLEKIEYIQLYQFADQYDITPLKNAVKNSIILTPLNIVEYANCAANSKLNELINYCIDYLIICIQYSLPIKDMEGLSNDVKILFAERIFTSPLIKRDIRDENISRDDCKNYTAKPEIARIQHQESGYLPLPSNANAIVPPQPVVQQPQHQMPLFVPNFTSNYVFPVLQNQQNPMPPQPQPLGFFEQYLLWQQLQQQHTQMSQNPSG